MYAIRSYYEALQLGAGISYTTDMKRYYPFGQLFTQLIGFTGIETEGQTGLEAEYNSYVITSYSIHYTKLYE